MIQQKIGELKSTNKKVTNTDVNLPQVDNARSAYANAFEFGPRDFAAREILPLPNFPPNRAPDGLTLGFAPNF